MSGSFVYFVKPIGHDGPIKIGVSQRPETRLQSLMSWSPFDLEIVAAIDGDEKLERRVYSQFVAHHIRHEWFRAVPELLAMIEAMKAGHDIEGFLTAETKVVSLRRPWVRTPDFRRYMSYRHRLYWAFWRVNDGSYYSDQPPDVRKIMDCWSNKATPSDSEIARLEEVIANPTAFSPRLRKAATR